MADIIFYSLTVWLAIIGAVHLLTCLWGQLLCRGGCDTVFLMPISQGDKNVEYSLRQAKWFLQGNMLSRGRLLIVDFGAEPETIAVCTAYMESQPWVEMCAVQDLAEVVQNSVCKSFKGVLY